ncbi:MAG: hypothetical protein PHY34_02485 [Patescibacteria group bacterium]|nr:hypothetical protein [Patescibacteria group bacterium]MDD5715488.1 hypothetical protein [Patescibacteria group bacterium]
MDFKTCEIGDILKLPQEELARPSVYGGIGTRVLEIERTRNYADAARLLGFLRTYILADKIFEHEHQPAFSFYTGMATWLQFIDFPFLLDEELYRLLKEKLIVGLDLGTDIRAGVKELFRNTWDPFLRGEKRDYLLRAFSENNECVGTVMIRQHLSDKPMPATVRSIILDYNRFAKEEVERGSLEEVRYIDNTPTLIQMAPQDREQILKILQIYDFVRFPPLVEMARDMVVSPLATSSSGTAPIEKRGIPLEPLRTPDTVSRPVQRPPALRQPNLDPIEILKQKYQSYRIQRQEVLRLEDELLVRTQGDVEGVKRALSQAARSNDKKGVIACLKILAQGQQLVAALAASPAWLEAISQHVEQKYQKSCTPADMQSATANIRSTTPTPAVVSELLQYLLKERLGMTENDSALVGVEVSQIMGGEYQSLAYGNPETGGFEWAKNSIQAGTLVSEVE